MEYFTNNLIFLRKKAKLRQSELAAELNLSLSRYSNYETGHSRPSIEIMLDISKYFGVSIDDLITTEISKKPHLKPHLNPHLNAHLNEKPSKNGYSNNEAEKADIVSESNALFEAEKPLVKQVLDMMAVMVNIQAEIIRLGQKVDKLSEQKKPESGG